MPNSIDTATEIKVHYQLHFAKNGLVPAGFKPLTFESGAPFAEDVLEALQTSDKWNEEIHIAIAQDRVYFKTYRDDEGAIPTEAQLLERVRILPNEGLLALDARIPQIISQWIPASLKSAATTAVDTMSTWLSNAVPSLASTRENTWVDMHVDEWKECIDASREEELKDVPLPETSSKETDAPSTFKSYSPFYQAINAVWQLASYTTQNPLKSMTFLLATQTVAAAALGTVAKSIISTSPTSSLDAKAMSTEPSQASQLKTDSSLFTMLASQGFIFPATFALSSLNGMNGFNLIGADTPVSSAGDVNGDGLADMIVGSFHEGAAYVVFGQWGGWPAMLALSSLNGTNGFKLTGNPSDQAGSSVSSAGDVNGDGLADMIVGASQAGAAYVVFGQRSGWPAILVLSSLNGTNGFKLTSSGDQAGLSVSSAGDVNGDGLADMIVGARGDNTYVVFGQWGRWPAILALSSLNGANGLKLTGNPSDDAGISVSSAGDVNGDGLADVIVGAPEANNPAGAAYVVFGQRGGWPAILALSSLNGTNGFKLTGNPSDKAGWSVSSAGDVNGDGLADMIVGAPRANNTAGAAYVVFGQRGGWPAMFALSSLNGANGFKLTGDNPGNPGDFAGLSVSSAGDVNGDGLADMIVGAPNANNYAGAAYVVFGHRDGWAAILALSSLNSTNGFNLIGNPSDQAGPSVSSAGDINGDGLADMIVGSGRGNVRVILGSPILLWNQLTINQNQFALLNGDSLYATYKGESANFWFNITALQNGQFYWTGTTQPPLTFFSQKNITEGKVQFKATDSTQSPQYAVTVIFDGVVLQPTAITSRITYYRSPVLTQNTIVINQGQTIILTQNNFSVTDSNPNVAATHLIFDFSAVQHGFFSFTALSRALITRFTQQDIISGAVQFTHDGSAIAPSYFFTVTDQYGARMNLIEGIVDFDVTPILVTNQLKIMQSQKIVFTDNELSATHQGIRKESLIFTVANPVYGRFYYRGDADVSLRQFYQKNISDAVVVFEQVGTIKEPQYQISVSDGRVSSAYEQAKVTFYLSPTPAPNSKTSADDFLMKSLISAGISGAIGLGFLGIKIYLSHKAQKKLTQITEEKEGAGKNLAEYRNNIIRPVARTIFDRIKLTGCLGYASDETMNSYLSAIETLVSTLSRRGVLDGFEALSVAGQHQIIHEVGKQTKRVLVHDVGCCSSANFLRFFRPEITPADIEKNAGKIVDCVVAALQQGITEDGAQQLSSVRGRPDLSGEGDMLSRPLLGMI